MLVLQHAPWERPGLIDTALEGLACERRTVLDEDAPSLPRARDLAGLVVMGGPQDADDDARHPGLAAERRLLAEAVDAEVPVLAVCLGMQLLALALGARLDKGAARQIGFALGVQMHPEMEPALLASWLDEPRMRTALEPGQAARLATAGEHVLPALRGPVLAGLGALREAVVARG